MLPNPYTHLGRPIRDFKHFYGRRQELGKLTNDVRNGQCLSVVGIRRIGKTSLARQLLAPDVRALYELGNELLCIYIDCSSAPLMQSAPGEIYTRIIQLVCRQLRQERQIELARPGESLSYYEFEDYILDLQDEGIRLVLLLDEFELLASNPRLGIDFFLGLRALHIEHELTYITVSQRPLIDLEFTEEEIFSSPFFNIFDMVRLGFFSRDESQELIRVAGIFSPKDEEFLIDLTGGHPLALQYACHFAFAQWQQTGAALTHTDHLNVLDQTQKAMEAQYRSYWNHLTIEQKRVLCAPAHFSLAGKQDTPITNLFKDLVTLGLLVKRPDDSFGYAGQLLASFVRQEMSRDISLHALMIGDLVGQTIGPYQIVSRLGRGGMADVYKARQTTLDRDVAIKVMLPHIITDEGFNARFQREAQTAAKLHHSNIVRIYNFGQENDIYYIVMEYVSSENLKMRLQALREHGERISVTEAIRITLQIGFALQYAHNQGVLHRDIKPANVLLSPSGTAILSDFGLAKLVDSSQRLTGSDVIGTPAYMAPERINESETVDHRADIYALGVMLYEMIAGQVPFDADTSAAIIYKHLLTPVPNLRQFRTDIPDYLVAVVEKALEKEPQQRYRTVEAMLDDLQRNYKVEEVSLVSQSGIPPDLYDHLLDTLLACGPFASNRELRTVFVEARLHPWRDALPEADNARNRARAIIDLLYNQYNDKHENALGLLLYVLAGQKDATDACYLHLTALAREIERL
ncbi:MAG: protein kinase [Anaerolineae bacterium]|nr:protein kinase [Anaerolineae bacterium]